MLRRQVFTMVASLLLFACLAYGLARLFALRFEHGDVYPAYSTLRSDPLGSKALYEAFEAVPRLAASRNYRPLPRLRPENPVTLIYVGVTRNARWGKEELGVFHTLVANGTRAVITFLPLEQLQKPAKSKMETTAASKKAVIATPKPADGRPRQEDVENKNNPDSGKEGSGKKGPPEEEKKGDGTLKKNGGDDKDDEEEGSDQSISFREVAKGWGLQFDLAAGAKKEAFQGRALLQEPGTGLEKDISWHSALYFTNLQNSWRVIYKCKDQPVVIERNWGQGKIVLASDSFFLSNEALRSERSPRLLSWLIGPREIVFDEEHHGVTEEPNMAGLAKKYRLQGVIAGLLLVAGLFVWRNVVRFVPPYEDPDHAEDVVSGQESATGFVNLLRRSIPTSQILDVCANEWRKSCGQNAADLAKFEAARKEFSETDPVKAYSAIAASLRRPGSPTQKPKTPKL